MSYATQKTQLEPRAVLAALALNGAVILALATTTIVITEIVEPPPLILKDIKSEDPAPAAPPPDVESPLKPDIAPTPLPPIINKPVETKPPVPIVDGPTVGEASEGDAGVQKNDESEDGQTQPPPAPIFQAARRHPNYVNDFQPKYPPRLLDRGIEGEATVKILIGANGRVRQASVVSASHPSFGKAAVRQALRKWRFLAATRGSEAVENWQTLTVRFTIN